MKTLDNKNLDFSANVGLFYARTGAGCNPSGDADLFIDLEVSCEPDACSDGECWPGTPMGC